MVFCKVYATFCNICYIYFDLLLTARTSRSKIKVVVVVIVNKGGTSMDLREELEKLELTEKERQALNKALEGVDLARTYYTLDSLLKVIRPIYKAHIRAITPSHEPITPIAGKRTGRGTHRRLILDEYAASLDLTHCPECGIHTTEFIDGRCRLCDDERKE